MKPTNTPPRINKAALRALRGHLKRLNKIYSYRDMATEIYGDKVSHGVLQRLATDKKYTPANVKILQALEVIQKPNPYRILPRRFNRTPEALEWFNKKREQIRTMSDAAKEQRREMRK